MEHVERKMTMTDTMKAVVLTSFGGPEAFELPRALVGHDETHQEVDQKDDRYGVHAGSLRRQRRVPEVVTAKGETRTHERRAQLAEKCDGVSGRAQHVNRRFTHVR